MKSYREIFRSSAIIGGSSALKIAIGIVRVKVIAVLLGPAGIGLLGIRERVIALGGLITLQTNKPGGLIIHIEVPVQTIRYSSL